MDTDYDELADAAERGELFANPSSVLHGAAAAAEGRRILREATGTDDLDELTRMVTGGRDVGTSADDWPVVHTQVSQDLKDRLATFAQREQRSESEIVCEALTVFLQQEGEKNHER